MMLDSRRQDYDRNQPPLIFTTAAATRRRQTSTPVPEKDLRSPPSLEELHRYSQRQGFTHDLGRRRRQRLGALEQA